jgi:hypothetical protein
LTRRALRICSGPGRPKRAIRLDLRSPNVAVALPRVLL